MLCQPTRNSACRYLVTNMCLQPVRKLVVVIYRRWNKAKIAPRAGSATIPPIGPPNEGKANASSKPITTIIVQRIKNWLFVHKSGTHLASQHALHPYF